MLREFQLHSWCIILLHLPEYRCTACHLISSIPRKQIICEIVLLQRDGLACPWLGIKSQHDLASKLQGGRLNQKEFLHTHTSQSFGIKGSNYGPFGITRSQHQASLPFLIPLVQCQSSSETGSGCHLSWESKIMRV